MSSAVADVIPNVPDFSPIKFIVQYQLDQKKSQTIAILLRSLIKMLKSFYEKVTNHVHTLLLWMNNSIELN